MKETDRLTGKHEDEVEAEDEPSPDGGWGWIVVLGSFLCSMVLDGIAYSFGILLEPMQKDLNAGVGSISLIGGVLAGVILATGPIAAATINRFGNRLTCIAGSLISSFSIFLSSFCNSPAALVLTYGLMAGLGLGFMYLPSVVAVGEYFTKRLPLATGICVCGSGVGTFLIAPLTSSLAENYGWRDCNRVMSALCLACALCGLVMVPNRRKQGKKDDLSEDSSITSNSSSLSSNPCFWLVLLGNMPFVMAIYTSYTYLPAMAAENGVSPSDASFLIAVVGISNTAGRLLSGWMAGLSWTSPLGISISTTLVVAIFVSILPHCTSFISFCIIGGLFGLLLSSLITVSTPLLVEILGIQDLNMGFGILTFARGLAGFLGPPVSGFILDNLSASLHVPFFICSGLFLVSLLFYVVVWFIMKRSQASRKDYVAL